MGFDMADGKVQVAPDVLEKLLPGDDVVVLDEPKIGGGAGYEVAKRLCDVVLSSLALVVLAIPMGIAAVRVKAESQGPAIYSQTRVGKGGRLFSMYKFRSMYADAEEGGPKWADEGDGRVTPFGRAMRRTRFDEVPQFWNVVKGDMSLVGPRPERPVFCEEFEKRICGWRYRTLVKPGITGLAQTRGGYGLLPKDKVACDMEYIQGRSFSLDCAILRRTAKIVATGDGAR